MPALSWNPRSDAPNSRGGCSALFLQHAAPSPTRSFPRAPSRTAPLTWLETAKIQHRLHPESTPSEFRLHCGLPGLGIPGSPPLDGSFPLPIRPSIRQVPRPLNSLGGPIHPKIARWIIQLLGLGLEEMVPHVLPGPRGRSHLRSLCCSPASHSKPSVAFLRIPGEYHERERYQRR
ncbi:hypothetical protein F5X68DRAFT_12600 [Plectosphaerella plurivora]|uniref:Uncharacterized protein n=1 Tax=Plectosphaerella plurivora TaxID=936078 RepID=A0A9P8VAM0_9PEZI|nr:hypothetical protein F5X68DRAFT_12600 [Plectosphaerella plurivora]